MHPWQGRPSRHVFNNDVSWLVTMQLQCYNARNESTLLLHCVSLHRPTESISHHADDITAILLTGSTGTLAFDVSHRFSSKISTDRLKLAKLSLIQRLDSNLLPQNLYSSPHTPTACLPIQHTGYTHIAYYKHAWAACASMLANILSIFWLSPLGHHRRIARLQTLPVR